MATASTDVAQKIGAGTGAGGAPPDRAAHGHRTVGETTVKNPVIVCRNVNVHYGDKHAIRDVSLDIAHNEVISMIGPSGCGKSTFLRCLNRLNDTIPTAKVTGSISLDGQDV